MENVIVNEGLLASKDASYEKPQNRSISGEVSNRVWKDAYRRRRLFAKTESFLSSNAFVIIFLFAYVNALLLMFVWGGRDEYVYQKGHPKKWIIAIARGFGYTLNLNCALVIILAARFAFTSLRNTALSLILPFDKTFPAFHIIVGYCIAAAVIGHGVFHMVWIIKWKAFGPGLWGVNWCVCTGFVLSTVLLVMVVTSTPSFRGRNFPLFYAVHNFGALFFFILLCLHGVYNAKPYTFKWVLGPMFLYFIDRLIRRIATSKVSIEISGINSVLKGPDVLKITVPKSFNYRAGQYAEIKVPSISRHEWHPFTIASAPHEADMTFFVKALGDWTKELYSKFAQGHEGASTKPLRIEIRGPFGAPAQHVGGYARVVLISGGVGSTPFSSICRELHHFIVQQKHTPTILPELKTIVDNRKDDKIEEELYRCVNRAFSVNYGDPITGGNDEEARSLLRTELLFLSDAASPKPVSSSPFQRTDFYELLSPQKRSEHVLADRNISPKSPAKFWQNQRALSPRRRESIVREKTQNHRQDVSRMIGMSFNAGPKGIEDSSRGSSGSQHESNNSRMVEMIADSFAKKTMELDGEQFVMPLGQNLSVMRSTVQRSLAVLHSITLNQLLLLCLLVRLIMLGYASIFHVLKFRMTMAEMSYSGSRWLIICDLIMGIIVTSIVGATVFLEGIHHRAQFFQSKGHLSDFLLLLPLSLAGVGIEIYILVWHQQAVQRSFAGAVHLLFILPLTAILLGLRLNRIVGSRVLLADSTSDIAYTRMRAVDFIWTTPYARDDAWLLERLIPIADKTQLRLHRYITRESAEESADGSKYDDGALQTNYGRPDWDVLFRRIAQHSPSMSKVGVFFCGPKGMSKAVQAAIIKAQTLSNLRGTYLGQGSELQISSDIGEADIDLEKLRLRGSYIRFVFREENFG